MRHEDKKLVAAIRSGDKDAFEELFLKYYKALIRFAYKYVHSVPEAKDLVQESFSRVWELRQSLNPNQSIRSYIYNAVRNKALDYKKHQEVKNRNLPELRLVKDTSVQIKERVTEDSEFIEAVHRAVKKLPDRPREAYVLHRSHGLTYKEIADVMGISVKTVESHMTRALGRLRDALADYEANYQSGSNIA